MHPSCLTLQFVTELGMGDAYKHARPFPDTAAAQLRHAILRDHAVYYVLKRGDRRPRMQLCHDARECFVPGGRVQHDERPAVFREECPAREVRLASRG